MAAFCLVRLHTNTESDSEPRDARIVRPGPAQGGNHSAGHTGATFCRQPTNEVSSARAHVFNRRLPARWIVGAACEDVLKGTIIHTLTDCCCGSSFSHTAIDRVRWQRGWERVDVLLYFVEIVNGEFRDKVKVQNATKQ